MIDPITQYILEQERLNEFAAAGIDAAILAVAVSATLTLPMIMYTFKHDKERQRIKKTCQKFKGKDNKICVYETKIKMMSEFRSKIPGYLAKCPKQKRPARCKAVLMKNKTRIDEKTKKYKEKIRQLKK